MHTYNDLSGEELGYRWPAGLAISGFIVHNLSLP